MTWICEINDEKIYTVKVSQVYIETNNTKSSVVEFVCNPVLSLQLHLEDIHFHGLTSESKQLFSLLNILFSLSLTDL